MSPNGTLPSLSAGLGASAGEHRARLGRGAADGDGRSPEAPPQCQAGTRTTVVPLREGVSTQVRPSTPVAHSLVEDTDAVEGTKFFKKGG